MKTYVQTKTGKRYPAQGYASAFQYKPGQDLPTHCFLRDEQKGWRKCYKNEFTVEEIPDLPPRPDCSIIPCDEWDDQYRTYAAKYGEDCAVECLTCANIVKYTHSAHILRPDPNRPTREEAAQFEKLFGEPVWFFGEALTSIFNLWTLDVLKLEKVLAEHHGYKPDEEGSMADFIEAKFGQPALALIWRLMGQFAPAEVECTQRQMTGTEDQAG